MKPPAFEKQHIASLLRYIGISFITGAIAHGFFSHERSLLTFWIGVVCFVVGQWIEIGWAKNSWKTVVQGTFLALGFGAVTGGLQHFPDSPERSVWLVPTGILITLIAFQGTKMLFGSKHTLRYGLILLSISILASWLAYRLFPQGGQSGHDHEMSEEMQTTESHSHSVTSEKEFIREMIPHHEEAVQTSKIILNRSQNESLKKIAQSIVSAQEQEILQLKDWLNLWYPGTVGVALYKPMMRDLSYLQGEELDTTYMTDMILHHEGAITMAKSVLTLSPRAEVANLANGIVRSQSEEIKTFETLLANTPTKNKADSAIEEHSHSH